MNDKDELKKALAMKLLKQKLTYEKINIELRNTYGVGLSNTKLQELRKEIEDHSNGTFNIFEIELQEVFVKAQYQTRRITLKAKVSADSNYLRTLIDLKSQLEQGDILLGKLQDVIHKAEAIRLPLLSGEFDVDLSKKDEATQELARLDRIIENWKNKAHLYQIE